MADCCEKEAHGLESIWTTSMAMKRVSKPHLESTSDSEPALQGFTRMIPYRECRAVTRESSQE